MVSKMRREYRKDGEVRKSSEIRNVYFHAQVSAGNVRLGCVKRRMNMDERLIQLDAKAIPSLHPVHIGFITFTLQLDHLSQALNNIR